MPANNKLTTTISTKGHVILPKAIRDARQWPAGTRLIIENTVGGVLLSAQPSFAPTRPRDVFGSLHFEGKAKSITEMNVGIATEAKRRHARTRY